MKFRWYHGAIGAVAAWFLLAGIKDPGERVLAAARSKVGTTEDGGKNRGDDVDRWNQENGSPPGSNWCANFLAAMVRFALGKARPSWLRLSPVAKAWREDFAKAGRWYTAAELRARPELVRPGLVFVWDRASPGKPETAWMGHIGIGASHAQSDGTFQTVEGNSGPVGDRVSDAMPRALSDPKLLGAGVLG